MSSPSRQEAPSKSILSSSTILCPHPHLWMLPEVEGVLDWTWSSITPVSGRGPHYHLSQPHLLFLVPPGIAPRASVFPPKPALCFHRNGVGGFLPHKRELHLGCWGAAGSSLFSSPPPQTLLEQHVPPTMVFNAFILPLNLSRIVIRFS